MCAGAQNWRGTCHRECDRHPDRPRFARAGFLAQLALPAWGLWHHLELWHRLASTCCRPVLLSCHYPEPAYPYPDPDPVSGVWLHPGAASSYHPEPAWMPPQGDLPGVWPDPARKLKWWCREAEKEGMH